MSLTINHQTNDISASSGSMTVDGAAAGGGTTFIASSGTISNAASVVFTQFDASKYDNYQFFFQHVIPVTDAVILNAVTSSDGGSSYATTNGDYHWNTTSDIDAMAVAGLDASYRVGSDTNEYGVSGPFELYSPHTVAYTYARSNVLYNPSNAVGYVYASTAPYQDFFRIAAEDVDAIKFLFSSGNIESGEIVMYGIANGT